MEGSCLALLALVCSQAGAPYGRSYLRILKCKSIIKVSGQRLVREASSVQRRKEKSPDRSPVNTRPVLFAP